MMEVLEPEWYAQKEAEYSANLKYHGMSPEDFQKVLDEINTPKPCKCNETHGEDFTNHWGCKCEFWRKNRERWAKQGYSLHNDPSWLSMRERSKHGYKIGSFAEDRWLSAWKPEFKENEVVLVTWVWNERKEYYFNSLQEAIEYAKFQIVEFKGDPYGIYKGTITVMNSQSFWQMRNDLKKETGGG